MAGTLLVPPRWFRGSAKGPGGWRAGSQVHPRSKCRIVKPWAVLWTNGSPGDKDFVLQCWLKDQIQNDVDNFLSAAGSLVTAVYSNLVHKATYNG